MSQDRATVNDSEIVFMLLASENLLVEELPVEIDDVNMDFQPVSDTWPQYSELLP